MQDRELKKLLLETCPVRPGQEDRAWAALREELFAGNKKPAGGWLHSFTWRETAMAAAALVVAFLAAGAYVAILNPRSLATADSQAPGIYATAFYSRSAEAQVVWLNGLEPASDRPTYLDPTTEVPHPKTSPGGDPNSL